MQEFLSMQLRDNALTNIKPRSRNLAVGRWWRWSRYELRDGYIRPAPGARLRVYDPWKRWLDNRPLGRRSDHGTPYRALLNMLRSLEYRQNSGDEIEFKPDQTDMLPGPLSSDSEQAILQWCATYGLLGILPHRVLQVDLVPQPDHQIRYVRIGIGWKEVEWSAENKFTPFVEARAIVQPLRGVGIAVEPLSATWTRYFPNVPVDERETFAYPAPLTDSFWEIYAEPLQDFLSGARALRELLSAIRLQRTPNLRALHADFTGGLPIVINSLVAPSGLGALMGRRGRIGLNWVGNSLLASIATMLLEDLSKAQALQCPCGQLFVSNAYQAHYCSPRCRWRFEQRNFRKKENRSAQRNRDGQRSTEKSPSLGSSDSPSPPPSRSGSKPRF